MGRRSWIGEKRGKMGKTGLFKRKWSHFERCDGYCGNVLLEAVGESRMGTSKRSRGCEMEGI